MKAKFINEKFTEDSDPIKDMGIGIPEITKFYSKIEEIKSMPFNENFYQIRKGFYSLKYVFQSVISIYIINHFRNKYGIIFKQREDSPITLADAEIDGYRLILEINDFIPVIHFRKDGFIGTETAPHIDNITELDKRFLKVCKTNNIPIPKKKGSN